MLKRERQKREEKRVLGLLQDELAQPRKAHSVREAEARQKKETQAPRKFGARKHFAVNLEG